MSNTKLNKLRRRYQELEKTCKKWSKRACSKAWEITQQGRKIERLQRDLEACRPNVRVEMELGGDLAFKICVTRETLMFASDPAWIMDDIKRQIDAGFEPYMRTLKIGGWR